MKENNWRERFVKKFVNDHGTEWRPLRGLWVEDVIAFIEETIKEERKDLLEEIEENRKDEMSASEGIKFRLHERDDINNNRWSRLRNAHKPEWIASEIYNQALEDIIKKIKTQ